jgi:hypothetical protein
VSDAAPGYRRLLKRTLEDLGQLDNNFRLWLSCAAWPKVVVRSRLCGSLKLNGDSARSGGQCRREQVDANV